MGANERNWLHQELSTSARNWQQQQLSISGLNWQQLGSPGEPGSRSGKELETGSVRPSEANTRLSEVNTPPSTPPAREGRGSGRDPGRSPEKEKDKENLPPRPAGA